MLSSPIQSLPSTSSITIKKLKRLGINTYFDLLNYFPSRYEDYSVISKIDKIQVGEIVTISGKIIEAKNQYTRSRITIQKVVITDDTGIVEVNWFNQSYLIRVLKIGETISVAGLVKLFGSKLTIEPKEYEINDKKIHTGRLVPVYSEKKGLSAKTIREKMFFVLNSIVGDDPRVVPEFLPPKIISFNNLIDDQTAYQQIHFPDNLDMADKARERLAFDELFNLQLANNLIKKEWKKERVGNKFQLSIFNFQINQFIASLPFKLTGDQQKAIDEIITDLGNTTPMNRFLQGDVGSGKTVVATIACYLSFLNGYQSIIMAPTEILANQHFLTIKDLFLKLDTLRVGLITGSNKNKKNNYDIIIGTHALLSQKLKFKKVGLVIIDEQHRFGVNQRALLKEKALNSHLLTMTATPGYLWIKKQIKENAAQVFIVCPLIEESTSETLKSVKAVKIEFENIKKIFNNVETRHALSLLHGRMKSTEKNQIMSDFKNKKIDILVSTPVVEVGIDIPGATIMIIEGAERFGLAQLHQLRGRVGRSDKQSYCLLFSENLSEKTIKRLNFFCKNNLGVRLAEFDLSNRGAGNIFGTEQHGFVNLKIANLADFELISKTKKAVEYFVGKYKIEEWEELKKAVEKYKGEKISRD
ncbi:MAG: helicase protein [Candidatus Roizmanbacteria bacterium GW2011_GWA2_33_33]|uniref:Helicase protein n=1 Tax=Candidatus Roizmanbacteria bacterium GW2011_GWA2_33_33 TaxID=1618476 RepID=A0A0G0DAX7_9BACT|nr:MAG: helicase protein [Candidatus Roizmanbacteria bacterium GW2011_GWA2_33_33]